MFDAKDWVGSWNDLADAALAAILFYVLIVVLVRVSGKRTTAELNSFDWIINVTVGSLAASGILLDSVPTLRATVAIVVIVALQYLLTTLTRRNETASAIIKDCPTVLLHKGKFLAEPMQHTRVSKEEILNAMRKDGFVHLEEAAWVILETDGSLNVVPNKGQSVGQAETMANVVFPDDHPDTPDIEEIGREGDERS